MTWTRSLKGCSALLDYDLEDFLVNWAKFVRVHRMAKTPGKPATAASMSIESRYVNPQGKGCPTGWGDYDQAKLPQRVTFDATDMQQAQLAESIIAGLVLGDMLMLKFHYVYRADPRATCRKVKIRITDYDRVLKNSREEVNKRLQSNNCKINIHSYRASEPYSIRKAIFSS